MAKWLTCIAALILLSACSKMKDPEFRRVENFGVRKLGFEESTVGFTATYYNPNNFGVTVKEAVIDVWVDSVRIGQFHQASTVTVNKMSEFSIPLEGVIGLQKALQFDLPRLLGKTVTLKADGTVKVGKAGVFISKPIHYEGRQTISADLIKNPAGAGS